jgi:hypothetical protein
MATTNNKFNFYFFYFLVFLGLFRCLYDLIFIPQQLAAGAWIAPRPHVFTASSYAREKQLDIETETAGTLSYNFLSEKYWPLKPSLLIFQNTLIHCLERPDLITVSKWKTMINYHFCSKDETQSEVKTEILKQGVKKITLKMLNPRNQKNEIIREYECLN